MLLRKTDQTEAAEEIRSVGIVYMAGPGVPPPLSFCRKLSGRGCQNLRWSKAFECRLLAEAVEEVGADRFCATIVPVG